MADTHREGCLQCGQPLIFLQPECGECGQAHEWHYEAACHECGELTEYLDDSCRHCGSSLSIWRALEVDAVTASGPIAVWKDAVPSPLEAGYRIHLGSIHGQWADYRRAVPDDGDFHVRSYARQYELHHDEVSAVSAPGLHMLYHGPAAAATSTLDIVSGVGEAVVRSGQVATRAVSQPYRWLTPADEEDAEE